MALWIDANNAHKFWVGGGARVIIRIHINCTEQRGCHQHMAFHEVCMQAKIDIQIRKVIEKCVQKVDNNHFRSGLAIGTHVQENIYQLHWIG